MIINNQRISNIDNAIDPNSLILPATNNSNDGCGCGCSGTKDLSKSVVGFVGNYYWVILALVFLLIPILLSILIFKKKK